MGKFYFIQSDRFFSASSLIVSLVVPKCYSDQEQELKLIFLNNVYFSVL
jgi:hypothetical protein